MKRLRIGILDLLTNTPREPRFSSQVMSPNFASITPQAVGVWAEALGHEVFYETFTGREDLLGCFPEDLDVLFISSFTRASYLAYGISQAWRRRGTVTVLGGPHARSFPHHARPYFDWVVQFTDREVIRDLLADPARNDAAVVVGAQAQPRTLPGLRERLRYVDHNMAKSTRLFRVVPMIGSLGCPYTCAFCVDAPVPYGAFETDGLVEDLKTAEARYGRSTLVGWHDPNFGIRFDEIMEVIDASQTKLMHVAEMSLSILKGPRLEALERRGVVGLLPGIESWFDGAAKSGVKALSGEAKLERVSAQLEEIVRHVPYVQANFVLGLDDEPEVSWALTKRFFDEVPSAFPAFSLITDFANSPLSRQLAAEGRTLAVPYPLLDNNFAINIRLKPNDTLAFYDRLVDLNDHVWRARATARRFAANRRWPVKLINFGRALTEGRDRARHYRRIRARLAQDPGFLAFTQGETRLPPAFYFEEVRRQLDRYAPLVAPELLTPEGFVRSLEAAGEHEEAAA